MERWLQFALFGGLVHFSPADDTGGDTESKGSSAAADADRLTSPMLLDPDAFEGFRSGVRRHGSLQHWGEQLFQDAKDAREQRRESEEKVASLTNELAEERRKRTSGSKLTPEDEQELERYRKLGKPDTLTEKIGEAEAVQSKLDAYERREKLKEAAAAEGYDADAVGQILRNGSHSYKVVEVDKENDAGETVKVKQGMIVVGEDDEQPLSKYLRDNYSRIEESLRATGDDDAEAASSNTPPPPSQTGASRSKSKKRKTKGVSNDYIAGRYGRKKDKA